MVGGRFVDTAHAVAVFTRRLRLLVLLILVMLLNQIQVPLLIDVVPSAAP